MADLLHFVFSVNMSINLACHQSQLEDIRSDKCAHLVENWREILISSRDLRMLLEATILQDAVKGVCLVNRLTTAMDQSKALEPVHINLIFSLILGGVLEGAGQKSLA